MISIENQSSKNIAKLTASTIDEGTTWTSALEDPSSPDFLDQEAVICSSVNKAGNFKSCKVEKFEPIMKPSGPNTVATLNLDHETTKSEPAEAMKEILDNYDSSGPALLTKNAYTPLTETDPLYIPKQAVVKLSGSSNVDFLDSKPEYQNDNSIEFKEASDQICERLNNGGRLYSCKVDSIDFPEANIEFDFETDSSQTREIIRQFYQEYDRVQGLPIKNLRVISAENNPEAPTKPGKKAENISTITAAYTEDVPWNDNFANEKSKEFLR